MALARGPMRPAVIRLLLVSSALLAGCHGCDATSPTGDGGDASVDGGGPDAGPGRDPIPGQRPNLSAPGEIVPLLYGRVVEARDELSGADQRFALDDPQQPLYQRFFGALNAACTAEIAPEITAPTGDLVLPGCGQDGAYQARLHLCRADAASAFIAGDGAGLVGTDASPRLSLPERPNPGDPLWSTQSKDSVVRASWAMLGVAELREAIASASDALDPESCEAVSDEHATLLAKTLREASELLAARTQGAAGLLQQARLDVHKAAVDDAETRTRVTRALNDSLLEQQKLYTGVPYALFSPLEPDEEAARNNRYPVLFGTDEATQRAATLLSLSHTRLSDSTSVPLSGEALSSAFADAMRAYEPKLFGSHKAGDGQGVLSRLDLSLEELNAGALLLTQRVQLTGAPVAPEATLDVASGLAHTYGADRAPNAYVEAITGARATRNDDKLSDYAKRGLHHALEAARLAARNALERSALPGTAEADLKFVAAGSNGLIGSVRICEKAGATNVERDFSEATLEFWQGEFGAACAVDPSCDAEAYRAPESDDSRLGLDLSNKLEKGRYYVTHKGPSETRQIVAGFSTALLDASDGERCYFVPLTSAMHESMRSLHDRDPIPSVPRTPESTNLGTTLVPSDEAAVATAFGRTLGGRDALGADLTLDLGEPLSTESLALTRALDATCDPNDPLLAGPEPRECGVKGLVRAQHVACRAQTLRDAAARSSLTLPGLTLLLATDADRRSLALLTWDEAHRAMAMLADLFDPARCSASVLETQTRTDALALLSELVAETERDLPLLTAALEAEANAQAAAQNDPYRRRVDRIRALAGSSLASARLLLSPPLAAYEPSDSLGQSSDPFDFALSRFPVVTRDAELAEDARAETLLRTSRLHPWLADQTVQDSQVDLDAVANALNGPELASRLRTALVALSPDVYGDLPTDAYGFLAALGVDNSQLRDAAVRIAQTAEIRGLSLLPEPLSDPLTARAMGASFPAPQGHGLSALAGGKLSAAADALLHHFALRGHYHTLAYVQSALGRAVGLPTVGTSLLSSLASQVEGQVAIEQRGDTSATMEHAIEIDVDGATSDEDALLRYRAIFSDTGLACALVLSAGGESCSADTYTSYASTVTTLWGAAGSTRRLRLSGFRVKPAALDVALSREAGEGRFYILDVVADTRTVIAGATLARPGSTVRHVVPRSSAFEQRVLELLAFKAPGEGCAACRPRSVCETTRCELDVCVRDPEPNGKSCGENAMCEAGECDMPGCGDGARADGTGDIPYEACDDGNLTDDDGCSSACLPELRSLEPVIEEGFPAGPATAIGVDGLGQQLLVYTADALMGDNQLIRAAVLDSFGVQSGSERTIDAQIPRVFIAEPCVAGLRDGGFAVVYGSPNIDGKAGLGVRIVASGGGVGRLLRVDDGNATAGTARVAAVEDGFVVVWSERSGNALSSRVRVRRFDSQGAAIGPSFSAANASSDVDQVEPNVISSLGQILVVWTERDGNSSMGLGIRGRRFFPFGSPIDSDAFSISSGQDSQAALTVLSTNDYLVAFTSRDVDSAGDVRRRTLRRFGLPLAAGESEPWIQGPGADTGAVIAALGDDAVLAYQSGAPLPITALSASVADPTAADSLAAALARARERDVSAFSTPLGVWFVWSERQAQGRALFAYLLPVGE